MSWTIVGYMAVAPVIFYLGMLAGQFLAFNRVIDAMYCGFEPEQINAIITAFPVGFSAPTMEELRSED